MEACPKTELIAIEDPATVCDGSLAIGEGREAQMIRHMRHGSPPRLMAPQPTLSPNRRESLATPSAGDRISRPGLDVRPPPPKVMLRAPAALWSQPSRPRGQRPTGPARATRGQARPLAAAP